MRLQEASLKWPLGDTGPATTFTCPKCGAVYKCMYQDSPGRDPAKLLSARTMVAAQRSTLGRARETTSTGSYRSSPESNESAKIEEAGVVSRSSLNLILQEDLPPSASCSRVPRGCDVARLQHAPFVVPAIPEVNSRSACSQSSRRCPSEAPRLRNISQARAVISDSGTRLRAEAVFVLVLSKVEAVLVSIEVSSLLCFGTSGSCLAVPEGATSTG
jgi:hypothetical protein